MNINELPNLCLRTIFSHLPLCDMLRLDMVCQHWRSLQPTVCHAIKKVIILVGDDAAATCKDSRFKIPHIGDIDDKEYKPVHSYNEWYQLEFDWLDAETTDFLIDLLPNITDAQICFRGVQPTICIGEKSWGRKSIALEQTIRLLNTWNTTLKSLKLCTSFTDYIQQDHLERDMPRLLKSLNSLQALRYLTLELQNFFFYEAPKQPLDMPFLARLEEFYLDFMDQTDLVYESFLKYGKSNPNLKRIGFSNIYDSDLSNAFFTNTDSLDFYSKFLIFPSLEFSEANEAMRLFCERFCSLRKISLSIHNMPMITKMIRFLKPLKKLVYLDMNINFDEERGVAWDADEEMNRAVPVIPSVKILNLYAPLQRHTDLLQLQWHVMFPNLEVIHYHDGWADCQICFPPDRDETDNENENNEEDQENQNNEAAENAENRANENDANQADAVQEPAREELNEVIPAEPENSPEQPANQEVVPAVAENVDESDQNDEQQNPPANGNAEENNQAEEEEEEPEEDADEGKRQKCLRLCLQPWRYCDKLRKVYTGDQEDPKVWSLEDLWKID